MPLFWDWFNGDVSTSGGFTVGRTRQTVAPYHGYTDSNVTTTTVMVIRDEDVQWFLQNVGLPLILLLVLAGLLRIWLRYDLDEVHANSSTELGIHFD